MTEQFNEDCVVDPQSGCEEEYFEEDCEECIIDEE